MSGPSPSPKAIYRPLGALRLALALMVVMGHAAWMLGGSSFGAAVDAAKGGSAAVFSFFMLSGFILSEAFACFYDGRPLAFAKNRALKILPTFIVALIVSLAVHAWLASKGVLAEGLRFEGYEAVPADIFGAANLLLNALSALPSVVGNLVRDALGDPERYFFVRYVWAVRVEVLFYTILALAILAGARRPELRRHGLAAVWAAVAAAAACTVWPFSKDYTYAPYFIVGVCLFWRTRDPRFAWPGLAGVALAAVHAWSYLEGSLPALACLVLFAAVSAVLCLSSNGDRRFQRADRMLGDVSYSLYLNQYAVLVAWAALLPDLRGFWVWSAAVALSLAVATALHVLFERPLMGLRRRIRQAAVAPQAGETVAAFESGSRPSA